MTGLPLAAGRMGMMATPMQSISPSNSLNNKTKPGLLKYLKTTYNNLPNEQKNLLKNLARGNVITPVKLYTYNSLAEYPYTYDPNTILPNFIPYGNTPADKLKDIIRRASFIPDFNSIQELKLNRLASHNKSPDVQEAAILTGSIDLNKLKHSNLEYPELHHSLEEVKKDPLKISKYRDILLQSLTRRRELLARSLGVYDKSKGSFYNEIPIENTDPVAQKYFRRQGVKNKVLTPKDETNINAYFKPHELFNAISIINENPKKSINFSSTPFGEDSIHIFPNKVSGNFTAHYDPNKKTIAAYDNFDFKPNSRDDYKEGFGGRVINLMRQISSRVTNPVPIYKEYDVSKFVKNKGNQ